MSRGKVIIFHEKTLVLKYRGLWQFLSSSRSCLQHTHLHVEERKSCLDADTQCQSYIPFKTCGSDYSAVGILQIWILYVYLFPTIVDNTYKFAKAIVVQMWVFPTVDACFSHSFPKGVHPTVDARIIYCRVRMESFSFTIFLVIGVKHSVGRAQSSPGLLGMTIFGKIKR